MPRSRFARIDLPPEAGIQDVFRHLANDQATDRRPSPPKSASAFEQGRKVLVLTERTEHLDAIQAALDGTGSGTVRACTGGCPRSSAPR